MSTKSNFLFLFDSVLKYIALIAGGLTLAFMTSLSVWNVLIMRKALNSPIIGAEDVLILLLVTVVAISIPLGARTGAHIEIELLEPYMSARFSKWSLILIKLLGFCLLTIMSWRLWHSGQNAERFGVASQERQIEMAQLYLFEAIERVNAKSKEAIVSFAEGAQQAGMIAGVKQYTKYAEYPNISELRKNIAATVIEENKYPY